MSCRVFGRQLECAAMNVAIEAARRAGAVTIRADYLPTTKNRGIAGLFPGLGFTPLEPPSPDGASSWSIAVADYVPTQTHIAGGPLA
jgi:predicted enzyme involved in methoxymalonyl-ACP biosynthesis